MKLVGEAYYRALDWMRGRKRAYQLCFESPAGKQVLADLAVFCRATETCFHEDPRIHAVLEGRREVFLRIQKHLHLSSQELLALAKPVTHQEDTTNG